MAPKIDPPMMRAKNFFPGLTIKCYRKVMKPIVGLFDLMVYIDSVSVALIVNK